MKNGRILAVGPRSEVLKAKGESTKVVDLAGHTMIPGFIDGHSHFINSLTAAEQANVYPAPFGPGSSIEGIIAALKQDQKDRKLGPGELIRGYGYDDNALPAEGKLTAEVLDAHFPDNPVMVEHVSMHGVVLNSLGLKKYNITAATPTPPGGVILRKPGSQEPAGLVMETAFLPIFSSMPKPTMEQSMAALEKGQKIYAAAGIARSSPRARSKLANWPTW
ncbi:MAG: amidohydrolase family protein [Verrucomicrobiales bacterium]|nr:amidohydrolase family protein [Verrucomicrobiales bacterium]